MDKELLEIDQSISNPDDNHQGEYIYKLFYLYRGQRDETRARQIKTLEKKLSKEDIELAKKLHNTFTPEEFERELDQIKDGGPS